VSDFHKKLKFLTDFKKRTQISKFIKILPVAEKGQTDMTNLTVALAILRTHRKL